MEMVLKKKYRNEGTEKNTVEKQNIIKPPCDRCPQLPGTILRINIPAGAVINILNLIELTSPSGICLIIRLPLLGGLVGAGNGLNVSSMLIDAIEKAGGTIDIVEEK